MPENNNGYLAVTSAVIITAIILAIVGIVSLVAYTSRFNILGAELKERTKALAEACMDVALLQLMRNPSYAGSEIVTVSGSATCEILAVETQGSQKIVKTRAALPGATSNIRAVVTLSPRAIVSWEEVPQF